VTAVSDGAWITGAGLRVDGPLPLWQLAGPTTIYYRLTPERPMAGLVRLLRHVGSVGASQPLSVHQDRLEALAQHVAHVRAALDVLRDVHRAVERGQRAGGEMP
jgi:hypothetical protein